MRVAITGISGRLGRLLTQHLHRANEVVGIDRRPFHTAPSDVKLHRVDIRRKRCEQIFRSGGFDAVVHLNVVHDPRASSSDHHTFNIKGTARVMDYCVRHGIPKLVLLSSANVYGPRPDNSQFLTEDAPLMAGERFSGIRALIEVDMLGQSFFWKHPEIETVILRPVHILGTVHNAPSNYLRLKTVPRLAGFDPMLQFIHELDVVRAVEKALFPGIQGVFNVTGCEAAPLSEVLRRLGVAQRRVPYFVAEQVLDRLWRLHLSNFPTPELDHLRYVCMVDGSLAKTRLGFEPKYDLEATLTHIQRTRIIAQA